MPMQKASVEPVACDAAALRLLHRERVTRSAWGGPAPTAGKGRQRRASCTRRAFVGYQRGIAVIMVLWLTIMLTVIASGFAFSMRSEAVMWIVSLMTGLRLVRMRGPVSG